MLWRAGTVRMPPCHQRSKRLWCCTPVFPASYRAAAMAVPTRLVASTTIGSRFGFTGSLNGGTNIRAPRLPIWCTSHTTSGNHSRYSTRDNTRVSVWVSMNQSRLLSCPVYGW